MLANKKKTVRPFKSSNLDRIFQIERREGLRWLTEGVEMNSGDVRRRRRLGVDAAVPPAVLVDGGVVRSMRAMTAMR